MLRPPQHRADAPIVFIHPQDDAWDHEALAKDAPEDGSEILHDLHPVRQYWGGFTRYDLVPEVQRYLKRDSQPTKFHLRRLKWEDWLRCRGMWERSVLSRESRPVDAYVEACRLGLARVENGPDISDSVGGRVSDRDMQKLQDLSTERFELVLDIGQAVYQASMPLSDAEKKA